LKKKPRPQRGFFCSYPAITGVSSSRFDINLESYNSVKTAIILHRSKLGNGLQHLKNSMHIGGYKTSPSNVPRMARVVLSRARDC